uniref:Uncharacterized protein n=1 Tax=Neobodo designis TaxID=312471 RepID=A0A7S1MLD4_NEODS|mmetsp:Transcript_42572/g.131479  ORF Transcript_42572/g.131479 Transcript_42572/m.131479 type:complete len:227 (+) Transcript_42572:113-793(+)
MVVDTLMFSCAAAVFCEGDLPSAAPRSLARAYAALLGLSMGMLVVSVWLSLRLQGRMAQYDMHRPRQLYVCGRAHRHFNSYFRCHCRHLEALSFGLFVVGTVACVASGGIYLSAAMYYNVGVPTAAWTFAAVTGLAIIVALVGLGPTALGGGDDHGADGVDPGGLAAEEREREAMAQRAADAAEAAEGGGAGQQDEYVAPPTAEAVHPPDAPLAGEQRHAAAAASP